MRPIESPTADDARFKRHFDAAMEALDTVEVYSRRFGLEEELCHKIDFIRDEFEKFADSR